MISIQYTFKGNKYDQNISASTTIEQLLEAISNQTQVPTAGLKVMFKGKVLRPNSAGDLEPLLAKHPDLANGAKIFVLGTTGHDIAKVHSIDERVQIRKSYRPPPSVNAKLSPAEKTILGYNRNKGELIALRLRTDDLEGFRHYDAVRKVLLHELAHNVWSEHDDNFHALNRQLNKEVQKLDWTAQNGQRVSKDSFFDPAHGLSDYHDDLEDHGHDMQTWQGGTFVLGRGNATRAGGSNNDTDILTTRELAARAAQLRQIETEKDEDGMCGAK
ncbi:hypothetical protein BGZ51_005135 [Haplosporangium sp. Z 767]|nr:hypothetical protein BGZ51_005135 [Haplosporangium sp. Z 767]